MLTPETMFNYLQSGCKPKEKWAIGTEHEKFVFDQSTLESPEYNEEHGIRWLLEQLEKQFDWQPVFEKEYLIALKKDRTMISLEPAGQLELSGAPLHNLHQTAQETTSHLQQLKTICQSTNLNMTALGYHPDRTVENAPLMPKGRYQIMRNYMPKVGQLGLEMMHNTCTVQVNLDYSSEQDMVKKIRVSMALQPIATALFASSPLRHGQLTPYQSFRSHIWTDTDPNRCGLLDFVFDHDMGFRKYIDYICRIPMYFLYRHHNYFDFTEKKFSDFLTNPVPYEPTIDDFINQLSFAFPEVRLKTYLEMRGADAGPLPMLIALPSLWTGLLYDQQNLDKWHDIVMSWPRPAIQKLRQNIPTQGMHGLFLEKPIWDWSEDLINDCISGLQRRAIVNQQNQDEAIYLQPLQNILHHRQTTSDKIKEIWEKDHNIGSIFQTYQLLGQTFC